ncbi:polysaccharide deacetylase family protein [Actinomadura sp. 21ATH]|uniref:polysaccharide deacetylase family protein n=1 Tax=Actinomadura sp. 21ATH TaxID=1735444 RepID=UPI0035BFC7B4
MRIRTYLIPLAAGSLLAAGCAGQGGEERRAAAVRQQVALKKKAAPKPPPPRRIDCVRVKCLALTFDDGPGEYTGQVLDDLRGHGVRATFYMLGQNVGAHRGLVRRMALEGHEVANHSWSHADMTGLSSGAVRSEVKRTQDAIKQASGVAPTSFRPPYGSTDARVGKAVGMPQILWSVDSLDWLHRNVRKNVRAGVSEPEKGGVVLFHDIHKPTVTAVPEILAGLKKRGFTLVTVTELFQGQRLKPGGKYTELGATGPTLAQ